MMKIIPDTVLRKLKRIASWTTEVAAAALVVGMLGLLFLVFMLNSDSDGLDAQAHIKLLAQCDEQLHAEHEKNRQLMSRIDELSDKLEAAKTIERKTVK